MYGNGLTQHTAQIIREITGMGGMTPSSLALRLKLLKEVHFCVQITTVNAFVLPLDRLKMLRSARLILVFEQLSDSQVPVNSR
jgi:hypothetical protein